MPEGEQMGCFIVLGHCKGERAFKCKGSVMKWKREMDKDLSPLNSEADLSRIRCCCVLTSHRHACPKEKCKFPFACGRVRGQRSERNVILKFDIKSCWSLARETCPSRLSYT